MASPLCSSESFPMVGGTDKYSYAKNSSPQRIIVERTKDFLIAAISKNLDLKNHFTTSTSVRLADLGVSTGPTTFYLVKNIIEAVKDKYKAEAQSHNIPEFHVFFNDHVGNDFNVLFNNFPPEKEYFAAGVPGTFHGRLFPKSSLDLVTSSNSLHWLSQMPEELTNPHSPAYNSGRISFSNAPIEVCNAYTNQCEKDMKSFLRARAQELVSGGLMTLLLGGRSDTVAPSDATDGIFFVLESCLLDLAKQGLTNKEAIDSFNVPIYYPSPLELKKMVQKNECFNIVQLETFQRKSVAPMKFHKQEVRAGTEGMLKKYFGIETLDKV